MLANVSASIENATQDSAILQLQTLQSVIALDNTDDSVKQVALEVASTLTSKIVLNKGEVLDDSVSESVASVLDLAITCNMTFTFS